MLNFERHSLLWFFIFIALLAGVYFLRAFLGYRHVTKDAEADYDYKLAEGMVDKRLSREGYIRAYKRFYAPRNYAYIGSGILGILILTPAGLSILNVITTHLWINAGRPIIYAPRGFVWQFIMFFGVLVIWGMIAFMSARLYYSRTPKTLRDEMMKEMD